MMSGKPQKKRKCQEQSDSKESFGSTKENVNSTSASPLKKNKKHNKSNRTQLTVWEVSDSVFYEWVEQYQTNYAAKLIDPSKAEVDPNDSLIETSKCLVVNTDDRRCTLNSKTFGKKIKVRPYQLNARSLWGNKQFVPAVKGSKDDLVISHVCGTRECAIPEHIKLETKRVNDERTHCHYCLRNSFKTSGYEGVAAALVAGICNHSPQCGTSAM